MVTTTSIVQWSEGQISTTVDGAYVLMNADENEFYDLNRTASAIWGMLDEPISVQEISEQLIDRFAVEPERCQNEVLDLLGRLVEVGMVEVRTPG